MTCFVTYCVILENVPYAHKKNVYPATVGWHVLWVSVSSSWFLMFFKPSVALLIFFLDVLSVIESEVRSLLLLLYSYF